MRTPEADTRKRALGEKIGDRTLNYIRSSLALLGRWGKVNLRARSLVNSQTSY